MGEAKRKQFYERASRYAESCGISFELAARREKVFAATMVKYRKACRCPECGQSELIIDSTDREFAADDHWIWCSECGFTSEIHKKHEPLQAFYGFDIVGAMSSEREIQFGSEWEEFVLKDTIDLENEVFGRKIE